MKWCSRPFEYIYIIPNGNVRLCSWNTRIIGNLLEDDLPTIWKSAAAEEVRDSFRDGSLRYCEATGCPLCENGTLKEIEEDEAERYCTPYEVPVSFNLAIDWTCNHSCPSCRQEVFVPGVEYSRNVDIMVDRLLPYMSKAKYLSTNGHGDLLASPKIMRLLENFHPENPNIHITLETNGVLFDEAHWNRISHLENFHIRVVVTPNSFERATYKALAGGHDDLDTLLKNLAFIRGLRQQNKINDFAISFVSQDRNFRELPAFAQRCFDEFQVDSLSIKPIYKWFHLKKRDRDYLQKDILNPEHPYFEEYQDVWKDPRLQDPRIFWWGAKNIHPARKLSANEERLEMQFDTAARWVELLTRRPNAVRDWLTEHGYYKVGIYGYGRLGMLLGESLGGLWNGVVIANRRSTAIGPAFQYVPAPAVCWPGKPQMELLIVTEMDEYDRIVEDAKEKTDAEIMPLDCLIKRVAEDYLCQAGKE